MAIRTMVNPVEGPTDMMHVSITLPPFYLLSTSGRTQKGDARARDGQQDDTD